MHSSTLLNSYSVSLYLFPFFFFFGGVNVSVQFEYVVQEPCIERSCIEKSWVQKGGDFWWIFFSFICPSLI